MAAPKPSALLGLTRGIGEVTSTLAGISICCAIVILTLDAVGRHFNYPFPGAIDLVALFMAGIVYIGMVALQVEGRHLRMDLLGNGRLPRFMEFLPLLVGLVSMGYIAFYGIKAALESFERGEISDSVIDLPIWPARTIVAVGATLICVVFVLQMVGLARALASGEKSPIPEPGSLHE